MQKKKKPSLLPQDHGDSINIENVCSQEKYIFLKIEKFKIRKIILKKIKVDLY